MGESKTSTAQSSHSLFSRHHLHHATLTRASRGLELAMDSMPARWSRGEHAFSHKNSYKKDVVAMAKDDLSEKPFTSSIYEHVSCRQCKAFRVMGQ